MGCSGTREEKENFILTEHYIDEYDIDKEITIINTAENKNIYTAEEEKDEEYLKKWEPLYNEKDIKQCSIRINDELIPFSYKYKFPSKGNYTIKYTFPHSLEKACYMFYECSNLKKADLSNFDTSKLTNLSNMFGFCYHLETLIFFNSPIERVTNMNEFLMGCSELKSVSLSNFGKKTSVSMDCMFQYCEKLENVDLSNFKAKIISADEMFRFCYNLEKIDLSGLTATIESKIDYMFMKLDSFEKENLIIKDKRILEAYENRENFDDGAEAEMAC